MVSRAPKAVVSWDHQQIGAVGSCLEEQCITWSVPGPSEVSGHARGRVVSGLQWCRWRGVGTSSVNQSMQAPVFSWMVRAIEGTCGGGCSSAVFLRGGGRRPPTGCLCLQRGAQTRRYGGLAWHVVVLITWRGSMCLISDAPSSASVSSVVLPVAVRCFGARLRGTCQPCLCSNWFFLLPNRRRHGGPCHTRRRSVPASQRGPGVREAEARKLVLAESLGWFAPRERGQVQSQRPHFPVGRLCRGWPGRTIESTRCAGPDPASRWWTRGRGQAEAGARFSPARSPIRQLAHFRIASGLLLIVMLAGGRSKPSSSAVAMR